MSVLNHRPSPDLDSLRDEWDRVSAESCVGPRDIRDLGAGDQVRLDVYEDGNNLVVRSTVPPVKPEDLNVLVQNDVLTISGTTEKDAASQDRDYYLHERRYGRFSRSLELPRAVNAENAGAVFANGILTLTLPKTEKARDSQIRIRTK